MFVYELSGSEFESSCSHLNCRFGTCFEQGVPWHAVNYRVWIHFETCTWYDKNIQSNAPYSTQNTAQSFGQFCQMVECSFTNSVVLSSSPVAEMLIVGGNRIHQIEIWYYLGPSQTSKVEFFGGNCFRLLAVNFFCKKLQLRMFDKFHNTLQKILFMFC